MVAVYNSMFKLPSVPYKIIEYLATASTTSAENFWKMLKYNTYDALSKPNLTLSEKLSFLWKTGKQENYSIFLTNLIEDAMAESKCILKCYNYYIQPEQIYNSVVIYAFDFLYGGKMSLIDYNGIPVSRGDLFIHCILDTLNGAEVGGVGTLIFSDEMSRYDGAKSVIGNQKNFTGVCLYLSTLIGDTGRKENCGV